MALIVCHFKFYSSFIFHSVMSVSKRSWSFLDQMIDEAVGPTELNVRGLKLVLREINACIHVVPINSAVSEDEAWYSQKENELSQPESGAVQIGGDAGQSAVVGIGHRAAESVQTADQSQKADICNQDDDIQLAIGQIQQQISDIQTQLMNTERNHHELAGKLDNLDKLVNTRLSTMSDAEAFDAADHHGNSNPRALPDFNSTSRSQLATMHLLVKQMAADMRTLKATQTPVGGDGHAAVPDFDRLQLTTGNLQKDVCRLVGSVEDLLGSAEQTRGRLLDMAERIAELCSDQWAAGQDVNLLVQERLDRRRQYGALIEQLEQVKCVKADRDELLLQLQLKATIEDMRTKVSYTHFNEVTKDLSRTVVQAMERMGDTDTDWRRKYESLLPRLADKMDRDAAAAMERKLTEKMATLSGRLYELDGKLKRLAVADKLPFSTRFNTPSVLPETVVTRAPAQSALHSKRLGISELAEQHEADRLARLAVLPENGGTREQRFCGGTHTLTLAVERTSKKGDFIEQTGAVPRNQGVEMNRQVGTDGVLYRVEDGNVCDC